MKMSITIITVAEKIEKTEREDKWIQGCIVMLMQNIPAQ